MLELWQHAISPINLPFTVLFGVVMSYWILVVFGLFDWDQGHAEFGGDGHFDGDIGGHADGHGDLDGHAEHSGMVGGFFHYLHVGEMPFMIVATILSFSLWAGSVVANYFFNADGLGVRALMILAPVLVVAVIVTHFAALPFKKMYQLMEKDYDSHKPIVGRVGNVVTSEVSSDFGQIQIDQNGAPITINARTVGGEILKKGESALVSEVMDSERKIYSVVKYEQPKLEI